MLARDTKYARMRVYGIRTVSDQSIVLEFGGWRVRVDYIIIVVAEVMKDVELQKCSNKIRRGLSI